MDFIKLSELKIGDKFWYSDKPYLIVDLNLSQMSLTTAYPEVTCVLDLCTYKILCFKKDTKVIQDTDNIPV